MEKFLVEFVRPNAPYTVGERAGFPIGVARKLRDKGVAVFVKAEEDTNDDDESTDDDGEQASVAASAGEAAPRAPRAGSKRQDKASKGRVRVR